MRRARILRRIVLALFLLGLVAGAILFFFLPDLLESGRLKARLPFGPVDWDIRRAGPSGLDAADLRLGPAGRPTAEAASLRIDYGAASLLGGRIAEIDLTGLDLYLEWRDGRPALRSADRLRFPSPAEDADAESPADPPVTVGVVRVRNGRIHLDTPAGPFLLPFDATLTPETDDFRRIAARVQLCPRGQTATLDLNLDRDAGLLRLDIHAEGLDPARFADLVRSVPGLFLDGRLDLSAKLALNLDDLRPGAAEIRFALRDGASAFGAIRTAPDVPARFRLESADGETVRLRDLEFGLAAPVPATVAMETLTLRREGTAIRWEGNLTAALRKSPEDKETRISRPVVSAPLAMSLAVSGSFSDGEWSAEIADAETRKDPPDTKPWEIRVGGTRIAGMPPSLRLNADGNREGGTIAAQLAVPESAFAFGDVPLRFGRLAANASIRFGGASGLRAEGALTGTRARLDAGAVRIEVPDIRLAFADADLSGGTGALSLKDGTVHAGEVRIAGVSGNLPLSWPWREAKSAGKLSARIVRFGERELGSFSGSIRQTEAGVGYRLRHASRIVPGAAVDLDGETQFMGTPHRTVVAFETDHRIDPPLDLGRFDPAADGVSLAGDLAVSGTLTADAGGVRCPAELSLSEGRVAVAEPQAEANGVSIRLPMADLTDLRGEPGGRMRVGGLSFGAFRFADMDVRFQVESTPALLVERAGFDWCGGNVEARAFRAQPGQTEFDLLLYADRIHLARLLDQLGAGRAEGEGTVSGRIPVQIRDGRFRFSDGVLFSMPGRGGTLHVTGAEGLVGAVGGGTPQGAQLQLALAALESFAYDWARLRLNSEGDALSLALEFNGRPTEPLPFVYNESAGGFVRTEPGSGVQSRFQGIRLNLNLDLPLDDLLRYRGIFDRLKPGG